MAFQKGWLEVANGDQIAPSTLASEVVMKNWASTPVDSDVETLINSLHTDKADLASPTFTGTPAAPTAAAGTNTTQLATTAFVKAAVDSAIADNDAMKYAGSVAAANELPALANVKNGWMYKATAAFTLSGQNVEAGDSIIANVSGNPATLTWDVYQANIDGAVVGPANSVDGNVVVFDQATGKVVKDSGKSLGLSVPGYASGDEGKFLTVNSSGVASWGTPTDTDTHYTATIAVGAANSDTSDASSATSNSTTFLNVVENGNVSDSVQVTGSGSVSVSAVNGVVTFAGTDTVGIPVVESNGSAPSNLTSGGIFFRKAASA